MVRPNPLPTGGGTGQAGGDAGPGDAGAEEGDAGAEEGDEGDEGDAGDGFAGDAGEDALVRRIARLLEEASGPAPEGSVWIGDDTAVVSAPPGRLVLSTDAVVAGVHADLALVGLDDLGWKALTATLSDLAAMGGRPLFALITVAAPPGCDVLAIARGVAEASERWGCPVVGGDVTVSSEVMVSGAATGVLDGTRPPVTRAGASAGDYLVATGPLGASAAGLRLLRLWRASHGPVEAGIGVEGDTAGAALVAAHRRPLARLAEGVVARQAGATAMIDVSDGLSIDLHRLADASGVGFELDDVPTAEGATEGEALGGGEDYELVVAVDDPDRLAVALEAAGCRPPIVLGRCVADRGRRLLRGVPLASSGWTHPFG